MTDSPTLDSSLGHDAVPLASTLSLKRKAEDNSSAPQKFSLEESSQPSEFESGVVTCEKCGKAVSFRDEDTGGFTTKHWDAHKSGCSNTAQAPLDPIPYAPESAAESSAGPPSKRRRAKRTEEERIDYLRSDPFVAQFEPYRVLCASCDKWIRLRPNSTYCSIPWDAHRKSCLAKKGGKVPGNEERSTAFINDPDIKKFDSERVHCGICNKWVTVGSDEQAVQAWTKHRAQCQQAPSAVASSSAIPNVPPPSQHQLALASMPAVPRAIVPTTPAASTPHAFKTAQTTPSAPSEPPSPTPKDIAPPATPHDARRRNAEQRAAFLRADPLLSEVEPNRVFCSLCHKWVQLRQDSTYCAYPWQQHRGKCMLRHGHKAPEAAQPVAAAREDGAVHSEDESAKADGEEGALDPALRGQRPEEKHVARARREDRVHSVAGQGSSGAHKAGAVNGPGEAHQADDDEMDVDGVAEAKGDIKPTVPSLADLDSPSGRSTFILHSISYLFHATYEPSDEMTVAALVAYLNTAMPPDKHEDFDTAEVIRTAKTLQERGAIVFEGDVLKYLA